MKLTPNRLFSDWSELGGCLAAIGLLLLFAGGIFYGCAREYMEWKTMRAIQHQARP